MATLVIAKELAQILDISERRVNQIAKEEVIFRREVSGKFDVARCVEYFYREKLIPNANTVSLDREKALHEKAKREKAELELALMKKRLHKEEDIELALTPMLMAFRNRVLAIPPTIAEKLVGKNAKTIEDQLNAACKLVLTELAEYDQIKFGSNEYEVVLDGDQDTTAD